MVSNIIVISASTAAALLWTLSYLHQHHSFFSDVHRDGPDVLLNTQHRADATQLVFAIKHRSVQELQDLLEQVSDPRSPSYGQYLSLPALKNVTYNQQGYDAVMSYLQDHNVVNIRETVNRDFVIVDIPNTSVEQIFDSTSRIRSDDTSANVFDYNVPDGLSDYVDFISGAVHRSSWRKAQRLRKPVADVGNGPILKGYVTPRLLNEFYHIYSNKIERNTAAALFEALGQSYSHDDLFKFEETFGLPHEDIDVITGPNTDSSCQVDPGSCGEANLDVQYFIAIAQHARTTFWSIDANDRDPFLTWIVALADDANPPLVHSISYGGDERQEYGSDRFNQELIKLGLRGITVVVSSGDDGVNSPELRQDPSRCGMTASFPASSPYVVAVGATQGPESEQEEIGCSSSTGGIITSGGGFSNVFGQPSYQKSSVQHYLNTVPAQQLPSLAQFNSNGRAYPDVSLLGYNYLIFDSLKCLQESGTSASAPVFAAMLTLINDELAKNNLSSLGFINPLLYALHEDRSDIFNDIVKGDNRCAAGYHDNIHCCDFGFSAAKGWDPVTGLGSVHFSRLKKAILQFKRSKQMEKFSGFIEDQTK